MEKKRIFGVTVFSIIVTLLLITFLAQDFHLEKDNITKASYFISRTETTDTLRNSDGKFQTIYYPSIKNVQEKGVWKPIEEANSLKDSGIKIQFIETDENYPIEILDYNYTSVTIKLNPNGKIDYKKDIPIKLWQKNETKEEKFKKDIKAGTKTDVELKDKYKENYDNIAILDEKKKDTNIGETIRTYDFGFDKILEIGENSTTIIYNESSTPNVIITCNTTNTDPAPLDTAGTGTDVTTNAGFDADEGTYYIFSTNTGEYGWCKLSLNVSSIIVTDITQLNFTTVTDSSSATLNLFHYIYNYTSSAWNYLTNWSQSTTDISTSSVITSGFTNYNSSGYINFLLQTNTSSASDAKIDYIYATLTYDGLVVNTPASSQEILNTLSTTLNTSQSGYNNTIWYTWNSGSKNYTLCTNSNECNATITFPRQGYYNLTVYANKSDGSVTSKDIINLVVVNKTLQENSNDFNYNGALISASNGNDSNWSTSTYINTGQPDVNITENYILSDSTKEISSNTYVTLKISTGGGGIELLNFSIASHNDLCSNGNISFRTALEEDRNAYTVFFYNFSSSNYVSQRFLDSFNNGPQYYESQINWVYYTPNSASAINSLMTNNSNFSSVPINFTFNISDDNDYIKNISFYLDGVLNTTSYQNYPITANTNTTLNFTISGISEGTHTYFISAYDSDGEQTNSTIQTFLFDSIAPTITLDYPLNNTHINTNHTYINWTATDSNVIDTCQVWHNFTGIWHLNKTRTDIVSGVKASELYNISDRINAWSIWCNDSLGNEGFYSTNLTFTIDTIYPQVLNLTASQIGTSQNINFSFNASDLNYNRTFYSIFNSLGAIDPSTDENTTISCTNNSICVGSETLSGFGAFNITVYSRDLAGNENHSTTSFNLTPPSGTVIIGGGGGGSTNVILQSTVLSQNYSFANTQLDFILAKDSVKPRERIFYISNKNSQEIPVTLSCVSGIINDTLIENQTNSINICDYVTFENENLILSVNELQNTEGKVYVTTPENSSFGDEYSFTILAKHNADDSEIEFAKLSIVSRVPIWGLIYKYSFVPSTTKPFPVAPFSLFFSFTLFGLSLFFLRKLPLTSFLVSTLVFLISLIGFLLFL
jgi:hypothetical protein